MSTGSGAGGARGADWWRESGPTGAGGARNAGVVAAEAILFRVPFRASIRTSVGEWTYRESWIVRLFDASGRSGLGEAALDFEAGEELGAELARLVAEAVETLGAGDRLFDGEAGPALRCAFDSALLDLRPPVTSEAAGSVAVNATIGYLELADALAAAAMAVVAGFGTLKLKVGPERDTAELVERVAAIRAAAGPEVRLRLDANGAWDAGTALERIAAVAPYDIEYVEQPVAAGDPRSLAGVRAGSPVRIAADESVSSVAAASALLEARAADVLVVKPARVGGPTAAREIAALAAVEGVPVVISTLFETGVGIAAALRVAVGCAPIAHGLATADLLETDLLTQPLQVAGGRMAVPTGIELDEAAVRRYAVTTLGGRP